MRKEIITKNLKQIALILRNHYQYDNDSRIKEAYTITASLHNNIVDNMMEEA